MKFLRLLVAGAALASAMAACSSSNDSTNPSSTTATAGSGGTTSSATSGTGGNPVVTCDTALDCPDGAKCSSNGTCKSGNCVDGVCCNTVCNATCVACSAAKNGGKDGICGPVAKGMDPDTECVKSDIKTCGANGTGCNGDAMSPGCNRYPEGSACIPGVCMGDTVGASGACKMGQCTMVGPQNCAPYTCGGAGACFGKCATDKECTLLAGCLAPKCHPACEAINPDDKFVTGGTNKALYAMRMLSPKGGYTVAGAALFIGKVAGKTTLALWTDLNGKPDKKITEVTYVEETTIGWQSAQFLKPVTFNLPTTYYLVWQALGGEQAPVAVSGSPTVLMTVSNDGGMTWSSAIPTPAKVKILCE
jgi:hypothetical protein